MVLLLLFIGIVILASSVVFAKSAPKQFLFKKKEALREWEEKIFRGRVLYSIKVNKTDGYLVAHSENAASGIFYKLKFDPNKEPMVSWKWKVVKFPEKGEVKSKGGEWIEQDDYAARFYVIFPRLAFNLTKALEYVWDENLPEGTIMSSPYFKNIKIIVAESGTKNLKKWVQEERNIYDDFMKAFGRKPPEVGAIAIMTDTDNSASTAEAHYDNIRVGYKNEAE